MESVTIPYERPPVVPPAAVGAPAAPAPAEILSAPAESPEIVPEAPPAEPSSEVVAQEILRPYQSELAATGKLSEESLGKLAQELGAPRELIDYTYRGMLAVQHDRDSAVLSSVGGTAVYKELVTWATSAFTEEEALAFNSVLASGTKDAVIQAVKSLETRFTAVNGSPKARQQVVAPSITTVAATRSTQAAAVTPSKAGAPFANLSELMSAQRDPRYMKETAYTTEVYQRAAISKF